MTIPKLFGTDGIRRTVGEEPLTPEGVQALGSAIGRFFLKYRNIREILIVRDTRESGEGFAERFAEGLLNVGCDALLGGVLPTGAAGFLAKSNTTGSVVISASHNPSTDNGIKIILENGFKISAGEERVVERLFADHQEFSEDLITDELRGKKEEGKGLRQDYIRFLTEQLDDQAKTLLSSQTFVFDCANGSASSVAPELFGPIANEKGIMLSTTPDGQNINRECGSQHLESLIKAVISEGASAGFAFDGDADRVIAVDEGGNVLDGDRILAILATWLKGRGELSKNTIVATPYSNLGLQNYLSSLDCKTEIVENGDRNVAQRMRSGGFSLGGEQSGHTIIMPPHTTGDGLLTVIMLLNALAASGQPLSILHADFKEVPQVLINIVVREKPPLADLHSVQQSIQKAEAALGDTGRVIVRYSGTEKKARVLVECNDGHEAQKWADTITGALQKEIGIQEIGDDE